MTRKNRHPDLFIDLFIKKLYFVNDESSIASLQFRKTSGISSSYIFFFFIYTYIGIRHTRNQIKRPESRPKHLRPFRLWVRYSTTRLFGWYILDLGNSTNVAADRLNHEWISTHNYAAVPPSASGQELSTMGGDRKQQQLAAGSAGAGMVGATLAWLARLLTWVLLTRPSRTAVENREVVKAQVWSLWKCMPLLSPSNSL